MKRKLLAYCIALSVAMLFFGCSASIKQQIKRKINRTTLKPYKIRLTWTPPEISLSMSGFLM